jgi:hypothetical protein
MGDAKFSPGDNIQSQPLLPKHESQSPVQESFGGIDDQRIRIMLTVLFLEYPALMAEGGFIEKIKRRAEFLSKINNIAPANKEVTLLIYLGGERKKS